jgi:TP901 family phage tail tape measure protein
MGTEIVKFDIEIEQKRLARSSREVLQKFKALDRAFDKLSPAGVTRVDASMKKASRTAARLNAEVRGASGQMNNLGRQAQITAKRFLVYNVIARFFFALANAIQEGTAAFISFDQELNKARQILNPLITDFDQFTKSIFELADAFGVTVKEVQAAQEVFIRQGKTQAQVTELTSQSLALAAAAGIEFAQATEAITASLNQFTGQGLVAVDIADKFTAVSIRSAVTADDLAQAIFRAGSAAATVGVEFDNLIGFITAAQEATRRGGRVIGTGLRTIFTRIFRAPSIAAMEELGIETRKTTGEFKDADVLIAALADRFTTLSQTQQIAIASTIAGQRQVATLLALLRNFSKAQDAANDSTLAQGEAARLVRIRQEALSFQIQKITNQFVKFGVALGDVFSGPIIDEVAGIADNFAVLGSVIEATGP